MLSEKHSALKTGW